MKPVRNFPLALLLFVCAVPFAAPLAAERPSITVYKTPSCGCCGKWVSHLEASGFQVETVDLNDLRMIKSVSGITPALASCHTARVGDYVIEGHVPAADIERLLAERPAVSGLTVPGMPHGSPGMETGRKDPYQVLSFDAEGNTKVFAEH